jgi:YjbE family integral membrane protein
VTPLDLPDWFGRPLAVLLTDLSLAGDNVLAIALVSASLPSRSRRLVLLIGTLGAIVLRILLAGVAGLVLAVPGLKLVGGLALAFVALNLAMRDQRRIVAPVALGDRGDIWAAAALVTLVDVLMSLDNVLALAAISGGSLLYLAGGLALSVSILICGSALVAQLISRWPGLARYGAALLGWVAGQMATTDALFQGALAMQAPALPLLVPALAAIYVYVLGRPTAESPPPLIVTAPRPPHRAPAAPTRPIPAVLQPPAPPAEIVAMERNDPDRLLLFAFVGLFVVVGLGLAALSVFAGGLIR